MPQRCRPRTARCITAVWLVVVLSLAAACSSGGPSGSSGTPAGVNPNPEKGPGQWVVPDDPDLSSPESAVRSYLDWISIAYRLANSDVATHTMSPAEEVRVSAYVELNRQQNRGIDQRLLAFDSVIISPSEPTATVAAREEWEYRYFTLDTIEWSGPLNHVSYEVTYTVVRQPDGRWLVDSVEATSPVEVP